MIGTKNDENPPLQASSGNLIQDASGNLNLPKNSELRKLEDLDISSNLLQNS